MEAFLAYSLFSYVLPNDPEDGLNLYGFPLTISGFATNLLGVDL